MKKLVIFDLDGTLLNTIADLATATNHALQQLGYPTHSVDAIRTYVGNGINKLLERALPPAEQSDQNINRMRSLFIPYYNEHSTDLSSPYPGIIHLLEELHKKGIMMAVASNKYHTATIKLIKHYFPNIHFTEILGQRDGIAVKPAPTIVYEIMKIANVQKEDVLYVGDSDVDIKTAHNAEVDAIAVTWGFRSREELAFHHPKGIIDIPEELLFFLN